MVEFTVADEFERKRLDVTLASHEQVASRTEASKLIKQGKVQLNRSSEKLTAKSIVFAGDFISFAPFVQEPFSLKPEEYPLEIHYEDDELLVVYKPKGMVVHPSPGHPTGTLVNFLLSHSKLSPGQEEFRPGIVHRIDKDTSGLLLIAKTSRAHENLSEQFAEHSIERVYQALVWGKVLSRTGTIDQPLGRHVSDRKKRAVVIDGKRAVTHWTLIRQFALLSHVECRLETGRTHQIRVHLSSEGFPILGDLVYGRKRKLSEKIPEKLRQAIEGVEGQMLHAGRIGFKHPVTNEFMAFNRKMPDSMLEMIQLSDQYKGF